MEDRLAGTPFRALLAPLVLCADIIYLAMQIVPVLQSMDAAAGPLPSQLSLLRMQIQPWTAMLGPSA